jgi:hypothetical protein
VNIALVISDVIPDFSDNISAIYCIQACHPDLWRVYGEMQIPG